MKFPKRMRYVLLAATIAAGTGGVAIAQNAVTYDPAQLPATTGKVAQYSLTPRGDVDGLILQDGTEVHFPPHLGTQLVFVAKPGDSVTIHGLKARNVAMVMAMQVTNDTTNKSVTDAGRPEGGPMGRPDGDRGHDWGRHHEHDHGPGREAGGPGGPGPMRGQPLEDQSVVKAQLHGPRGDLNGVLLQDGTIVRLPPPEAQKREAALAVGKTVFVRGEGSDTALGKVIGARMIGTSAQDATAMQMPPRPDRHGPEGRGEGRGDALTPPAAQAPAATTPTSK
jgi:hypothetical protein